MEVTDEQAVETTISPGAGWAAVSGVEDLVAGREQDPIALETDVMEHSIPAVVDPAVVAGHLKAVLERVQPVLGAARCSAGPQSIEPQA